jgi:hypothetical protein
MPNSYFVAISITMQTSYKRFSTSRLDRRVTAIPSDFLVAERVVACMVRIFFKKKRCFLVTLDLWGTERRILEQYCDSTSPTESSTRLRLSFRSQFSLPNICLLTKRTFHAKRKPQIRSNRSLKLVPRTPWHEVKLNKTGQGPIPPSLFDGTSRMHWLH